MQTKICAAAVLAGCAVFSSSAFAQAGGAASGDPEAQYRLGFSYFQKRDYANACTYFQRAASQGHVASQSMIQMVNGYGYHCAAPGTERARKGTATLPDVRELYAGALEEARSWRNDAVLTYAQVSSQAHAGYYATTFVFASAEARQVLSLNSSQMGGPVSPLNNRTYDTPLPGNFVNLGAAVEQAHRAGMKGAIDNATLATWQGPGGPQLPGWLLHAPENSFQTFLIGALDGKTYPVSRYSYPVQGNDRQLRAVQQSIADRSSSSSVTPQAQRGNPCSSSGMVSMSQRMNWFTPCNQAALQRLYRQSNANYDLWTQGKRATPN